MTKWALTSNTMLWAADAAAGGAANDTKNDRTIPRSAADSGTGSDDKDLSNVGPTVGPGTSIPLPDNTDISPTTDDGTNQGAGGPVGGMGT